MRKYITLVVLTCLMTKSMQATTANFHTTQPGIARAIDAITDNDYSYPLLLYYAEHATILECEEFYNYLQYFSKNIPREDNLLVRYREPLVAGTGFAFFLGVGWVSLLKFYLPSTMPLIPYMRFYHYEKNSLTRSKELALTTRDTACYNKYKIITIAAGQFVALAICAATSIMFEYLASYYQLAAFVVNTKQVDRIDHLMNILRERIATGEAHAS